MKKNDFYSISPKIQKIFVWLTILSLLAPFLVELYYFTHQLKNDPNIGIGLYLLQSLSFAGVPPLLFFITYFLKPPRLSPPQRLFETSLLATMGIAVLGMASYTHIFDFRYFDAYDSYWQSLLFSLIPSWLVVIVYTIILYRWRSKHSVSSN